MTRQYYQLWNRDLYGIGHNQIEISLNSNQIHVKLKLEIESRFTFQSCAQENRKKRQNTIYWQFGNILTGDYRV